jgi:PAS domain S-box-containing protein
MASVADISGAAILVVDDREANVSLLEQILSEEGYTRITTTTDPQEVCALHLKNRYDLILLDLQMPGMDGFEVMDGLKAIESETYLPVIVLTAQPTQKLRALKAGARDFISKPFELVDVTTRIRNMLEVRVLYRQLENYSEVLELAVQERTAELRESEARYRSLAEMASDWQWEQDETGTLTRVSGNAFEMLGIRPDTFPDPAGRSPASGWNDAERAQLRAKLAARQAFLNFVFTRVDSDGSLQQYQVSGEPIFNESRGYAGYRGIGREITLKK